MPKIDTIGFFIINEADQMEPHCLECSGDHLEKMHSIDTDYAIDSTHICQKEDLRCVDCDAIIKEYEPSQIIGYIDGAEEVLCIRCGEKEGKLEALRITRKEELDYMRLEKFFSELKANKGIIRTGFTNVHVPKRKCSICHIPILG